MIFLTLGTQKHPFDRLLTYIDHMISEEVIVEEVFAQIGNSKYQPINYEWERFLDSVTFKEFINKSSLVITHGGTGSIVTAMKAGKKVIAVPRKIEFGEHVDDHQMEIVELLIEKNYILGVKKLEDLPQVLKDYPSAKVQPFISNTNAVLSSIEEYIMEGKEWSLSNNEL